ncbi:MAG: energy-coupling factor transporter transmembrane protein EcfT [Clostridiales bacterium]|nr:energy-coupling factor transporter transmembrane protein EcfT [Clostridiales bacterium]
MNDKISLGRYYETHSVLHTADPRVKAVLYLLYLIAIFMLQTRWGLLLAAVITAIQYVIAKIPLRIIWSTVKPVLPLAFFIFLINLFSVRGGEILFSWHFISFTDEGAGTAILMALRLLFLILSTSVMLTLTTTPLKLSDALESLFAPLKLIRVPVHEMAMMMSIALRFIPTLATETDKIMKAQMSRGAEYDNGSLFNRVRGYITVLVPLFVSSFKRAEELAVAMDARCYRGGEGRTKLNPLKITFTDMVIAVVFALGAAVPVVVDFLLR